MARSTLVAMHELRVIVRRGLAAAPSCLYSQELWAARSLIGPWHGRIDVSRPPPRQVGVALALPM